MSRARATARSIATLGLLGAVAPLNAALTGTALAARAIWPGARTAGRADGRTVLVTGGKMTKAVHLARCFARAGHRVVLAEAPKYRWSGHRFSNCVDRFVTLPAPGSPGYADELVALVAAEGVDVVVPVSSPASSVPEAEAFAKLPDHVLVVHGAPATVARLDDKAEFAAMCAEAGLAVPDAHRVRSTDDVLAALAVAPPGRRYVLKSIAYDPVARLDLTPLPRPTVAETRAFVEAKGIGPDRPWVLQELLEGPELCSHSTVVDGVVTLHVTCASSAFQVNYDPLDRPDVEAWVATLAAHHRLTGQVSVDFIDTAEGLRAIECNPRTHSAITAFDDPGAVAEAYLGGGDGAVVRPRPGARPTYWAYHEAWRALSHPLRAAERLGVVLAGRDAIFDWRDPLPFFAVHHVQIPSLLLADLTAGREWVRIDFNIGKLVEPAGD